MWRSPRCYRWLPARVRLAFVGERHPAPSANVGPIKRVRLIGAVIIQLFNRIIMALVVVKRQKVSGVLRLTCVTRQARGKRYTAPVSSRFRAISGARRAQ